MIFNTMLGRADLEPAHEFLKELKLYCKSEAERFYKEIQSLGQEIYKEKLQKLEKFWKTLQARWGQGVGYNRYLGIRRTGSMKTI